MSTLSSDAIKAAVANYYRYDRQASLIAFEASDRLNWGGEPADVLVMTNARMLYEIEVKISINDLKHDLIKNKHDYFKNGRVHPVNRFFFALPKELAGTADDICESIYPYAGVIAVSNERNGYGSNFVEVRKEARLLHSNKLGIKSIIELTKQQTSTLCRLARDHAATLRIAEERWTEIKQLRGNLELVKADLKTERERGV